MDKNLLFALDIGTRSVVGIVGEQTANDIKILAIERQEHKNRAMLDGQIHDVPEVAEILAKVITALADKVGPLKKVAIAAAGRALCTIKASAEIDCNGRGALTIEDERALELAAIQVAQHKLATGSAVDDPSSYYCVGYSVIRFTLDSTPIKTLAGQRGKLAAIELIATFLPRQVVDSLQSAVESVGLEISTLTLEPIAAINVLIPATMRHLNLTLVDVGAGTSDVAITRDGSVIGYGMVPFAGDEITEAISHEYLLDFRIAEELKRKLGDETTTEVTFSDVLGFENSIPKSTIIEQLQPTVNQLANAIAEQIMILNATAPQAVLLVGGGSLTPKLPETLAQVLSINPNRVAVRKPDSVDGIATIPEALCAPDAVTPLGILKLAGGKSLNFVNVTLNGETLRLFNLGKLSVADALLVAGVDVRSLHGRPGFGLTITINGEKKFIPGTMGQSGFIQVNGKDASFDDTLSEGDCITLQKGQDGISPDLMIKDILQVPAPYTVIVNDDLFSLEPAITVNGLPATPETKLADRDKVVCHPPATLAEALTQIGMKAEPTEYSYLINGSERIYRRWPEYTVNGVKGSPTAPIYDDAIITITAAKIPSLSELLGLTADTTEFCTVSLNETSCKIPIRRFAFTIAGKPAQPADAATPGSSIEYSFYEIQPMVSDVLLAAEFDARSLPPNVRIEVTVNGQVSEYTTPVKNGDIVLIRSTTEKQDKFG